MAKPNYQFEKRQRDLAKKSRQEEKRRQKQANKAGGDAADSGGQAGNPDPASSGDHAAPLGPETDKTTP